MAPDAIKTTEVHVGDLYRDGEHLWEIVQVRDGCHVIARRVAKAAAFWQPSTSFYTSVKHDC